MPVARRRTRLPAEPPPCPPGARRVVVEDWLPPRLNEFADRHWSARKRAKDGATAVLALALQSARVPRVGVPKAERDQRKALGLPARLPGDPEPRRRRVSLWIGLARGMRRADPDAWHKALLDALVRCGALFDDGPAWCEIAPVEYGRCDSVVTVLTLEDIE